MFAPHVLQACLASACGMCGEAGTCITVRKGKEKPTLLGVSPAKVKGNPSFPYSAEIRENL